MYLMVLSQSTIFITVLNTSTMAKSSKLVKIMQSELPVMSFQRRFLYRTSEKEVAALYRLLNREIFNGKLPTPVFEIGQCRNYWGFCYGKDFNADNGDRSKCIIRLSDKWCCKQWLVTILAHEMCHQYQWDVYSKNRVKQGLEPMMSHGPSFFKYKEKLAKRGIALKIRYSLAEWFTYQDFAKC